MNEPDTAALAGNGNEMKPSMSEVRPHLFIGNIYSTYWSEFIRQNGITAIVSLDDARHGKWGAPALRSVVPEANHLFIPCLDNSTMDMLSFMSRVCDFIEEQSCSTDGGAKNVLVHCKKGISRSATVVIAYLMRKHKLGLDQVLAEVREKRKVKPNPNFMDQLRIWEAVGYQIWKEDDEKVAKEEYQEFLERRMCRLKEKGLIGDEPIEPPSPVHTTIIYYSGEELVYSELI